MSHAEAEVAAGAIEKVAGVIDHVARRNDRWWFITLLIIGMCYVGWERYEQSRERVESNKERAALREEINVVRSAQLEFMTRKTEVLLTALEANTHALDEFRRSVPRP